MTRQVVCNGLRKVKVSSSALQLSSTWHLALSNTGQVARNVFCLVVNDRPEHMTSQQAIINQNCGVAVQKLSSDTCTTSATTTVVERRKSVALSSHVIGLGFPDRHERVPICCLWMSA